MLNIQLRTQVWVTSVPSKIMGFEGFKAIRNLQWPSCLGASVGVGMSDKVELSADSRSESGSTVKVGSDSNALG